MYTTAYVQGVLTGFEPLIRPLLGCFGVILCFFGPYFDHFYTTFWGPFLTTFWNIFWPILWNKLVVSPCITRSNKSFSVHSLILNVTFPRFKRMCCCILKFWEKPEMVIWEFKTFFSPFWWWLLFATNVWGNVLSAKVPQNNEIWIKIASLKNFHWFSLLF